VWRTADDEKQKRKNFKLHCGSERNCKWVRYVRLEVIEIYYVVLDEELEEVERWDVVNYYSIRFEVDTLTRRYNYVGAYSNLQIRFNEQNEDRKAHMFEL
jgi:hypothetical protein